MLAMSEVRNRASITIGLRYDDCSALSSSALESSILEACVRHRIPCTFGVIPEISLPARHGRIPELTSRLPDSKREMLRRAQVEGVIELALHGYTHRNVRDGVRTEFAGVPASTQAELIAKGKDELVSFAGPIHTFIPPWNSYDAHTLDALSSAGFKTLSAEGLEPEQQRGGLKFVPATCRIPGVREAVTAARQLAFGSCASRIIIVPCFHPYEIKESGSPRARFSLFDFERTLEWLSSQQDVVPGTLGAIGTLPDHERARFAGSAPRQRIAVRALKKAAEWITRRRSEGPATRSHS